MPDSRTAILEAVLGILGDPSGLNLTLESAAHTAGLSKAGLMYYFPTKDDLVRGVIEYVVQRWADRLRQALDKPFDSATPVERITAYVRTVVGSNLDLADRSIFLYAHFRSELTTVWRERMEPWLRLDSAALDLQGRLRAARLAADGFWFAAAGGWLLEPREDIAAAILGLLSADPETPDSH